MKNSLLIIYTIILITTTVFNSGYFLDLKDYCVFRASNLSSMYILLIVLFGLFFLMRKFFEKKGYNGLTLIYTLPVILFILFLKFSFLKRDKLLLNSKVIIDRAIIVEKSNSKFSWHAISRFKINKSKDSISKYFKINGSLLKKKKIGDTILVKYVLECPNIATDYNFSPTQEEIKYYKGGRVVYPVKK
ncbi:hypothetical protein RRF68_04370 [Tenacibaculum sp. HL-MS23]|uniref:hypothetical protein n=1 Tax=Tenacibaculum sp. HL-MS23 TaxID=3077734 RepID=UPI0028FC128B|nr:hypothetical protein [Tenacibaculum sp. HL-MS23]WNW02651.1 hypothetical protein RRF68_04370 [Tenacibaculum sp. HL-MS23]